VPRKRNQVVVYGAGGHAKGVLATIEAEGKYEVIGLLDDKMVHQVMCRSRSIPVDCGREQEGNSSCTCKVGMK